MHTNLRCAHTGMPTAQPRLDDASTIELVRAMRADQHRAANQNVAGSKLTW